MLCFVPLAVADVGRGVADGKGQSTSMCLSLGRTWRCAKQWGDGCIRVGRRLLSLGSLRWRSDV